ncbi:MAG TPA: ATP-binding protein [Solirubrobacteraceae bacterium]
MASVRLIDREQEMAQLREAAAQAAAGTSQLVVVWGRRRVGKTFLLSHFARDARAVFFGATQQAQGVELGRLADAVRRDLGDSAADLAGGDFTSWEAALRFFAALAAEQPLTVVLDEVPYLVASTPGFASIVQAVWDHLPSGTRLTLVLTGSAIAMMETMIGAGGALRGRPTLTLKLAALDPVQARAFLPDMEPAAFLEAYAACGGYPLHLRAWDQRASTDANLLRLAATPGGILLEDAAGMLAEELTHAGGYARVLAAIGRGRTRYAEIAAESDQRVERPLEVLMRAGFIAKTLPVGAPRGARASYRIADPYLAFWFGVLYTDIPQIEAGQGRAVLRRRAPAWRGHLGAVFEDAARTHARRLVLRGELPQDMVIDRWWAASGEPCEIDVLGLCGARTVLLGEARWQARPLGARDLAQLQRKAARAPRAVELPIFALWGRGGVENRIRSAGVLGFDPSDVLAG